MARREARQSWTVRGGLEITRWDSGCAAHCPEGFCCVDSMFSDAWSIGGDGQCQGQVDIGEATGKMVG